MIVERVDVALAAVRAAPVRALEKPPPLAPVFQIDRMARRREHQRAGIEHVRQRAGIILRIGRNFGEGDVTGGFDEVLELPVGHRRAVDPEAVDGDAMRRRLFRIMLVRSHAERAAGNENHVRMGRLLGPLQNFSSDVVVHTLLASDVFASTVIAPSAVLEDYRQSSRSGHDKRVKCSSLCIASRAILLINDGNHSAPASRAGRQCRSPLQRRRCYSSPISSRRRRSSAAE